MAQLSIITAPDPRLKIKAQPVPAVDANVRRLMDDMLETMYQAIGIGLAAPQVGQGSRVIVLDVAREGEKPQPLKLANPEILWRSPELATFSEGCLSLPEHYADVTRPAEVRLRYLDEENEIREMHAKGLLATCVQHRAGKDKPVGRDHRGIGAELGKRRGRLRCPQADRTAQGKPVLRSQQLHW